MSVPARPERCPRCGAGLRSPEPGPRCVACLDEVGTVRADDDLDRIAAGLLGLTARVPGLAARVGLTYAVAAPSCRVCLPAPAPRTRWGYIDHAALQATARRLLPPAAWRARPAWAGDHR